jgi:hypothetical protein
VFSRVSSAHRLPFQISGRMGEKWASYVDEKDLMEMT